MRSRAIKKREAGVSAQRIRDRVMREITALGDLQSSSTVKYCGSFEVGLLRSLALAEPQSARLQGLTGSGALAG